MNKTFSILFLSIILLCSGCVVSNKYFQSTTVIDFKRYSEKGMFMTTGDFFSKYSPVGIVEVICYEGYKSKENIINSESKSAQKSNDDLYSEPINANSDFTQCSLEDLLNQMYNNAKEKGANGLIKIEIQNISRPSLDLKTTQPGIRIVGMAITY